MYAKACSWCLVVQDTEFLGLGHDAFRTPGIRLVHWALLRRFSRCHVKNHGLAMGSLPKLTCMTRVTIHLGLVVLPRANRHNLDRGHLHIVLSMRHAGKHAAGPRNRRTPLVFFFCVRQCFKR